MVAQINYFSNRFSLMKLLSLAASNVLFVQARGSFQKVFVNSFNSYLRICAGGGRFGTSRIAAAGRTTTLCVCASPAIPASPTRGFTIRNWCVQVGLQYSTGIFRTIPPRRPMLHLTCRPTMMLKSVLIEQKCGKLSLEITHKQLSTFLNKLFRNWALGKIILMLIVGLIRALEKR